MDTRRAGRCHRQFCLPKVAHVGSSLGPRGPPKKPMDLTHFQFENRSRATRCRLLQSFASPEGNKLSGIKRVFFTSISLLCSLHSSLVSCFIFSLLFAFLSCLVSPLSSSLAFLTCLVFISFGLSCLLLFLFFLSRLSSSVFSSLSLPLPSFSVSVSPCLRVMLRVVLCCVVVLWYGGVWHAENPRVTPSVSRFETSPCVPAPRATSGFLSSCQAGFSMFNFFLGFVCQILVRIVQTWLLGVSSNWRVSVNLCETCENVGEERGAKEERVKSGGGGCCCGGVWWRCVVV